jgi:hypothetical protein
VRDVRSKTQLPEANHAHPKELVVPESEEELEAIRRPYGRLRQHSVLADSSHTRDEARTLITALLFPKGDKTPASASRSVVKSASVIARS